MPDRLAAVDCDVFGIQVIIGTAPWRHTARITRVAIKGPPYQVSYHMTIFGIPPTMSAYRSSARPGCGLLDPDVTQEVLTPSMTGRDPGRPAAAACWGAVRIWRPWC